MAPDGLAECAGESFAKSFEVLSASLTSATGGGQRPEWE
jgi:hypothetical protein